MRDFSNRFVGGLLAGTGLLVSLGHVSHVVTYRAMPAQLLIEGVALLLSLVLIVVGALLARGRLIPEPFAGRMLAWTVTGVAALSALGVWSFAPLAVDGFAFANPFVPLLNVATFGALAGSLVGVYDVRGLERQESIERLNRINDTIRIATQELVNRSERDELERAVCDRLSKSDPYESVWIGRYDADATPPRVRPAAWAGVDDEYVESIEITVDDSPMGNGAGGRAIKTREIQCVPDVYADPTMEPWWDLLESRGVQSLAVAPIVHDETVYGFFSIYANRRNVFDEHEQEVLAELGETIGHAVASIEARERLAERERELAEQNERLDAFAGVVSHDLRNPLNVATGRLELARERCDEADEDLAEAAEALSHMEALIRDLLTLARQGETVDEVRSVPLAPVVDRAWSTIRSDDATLRVDDDLGAIACDRARLRQLLENLFRNAVEHGSTSSQCGNRSDDCVEHGGSDVTVTVARTSEGFVVEDDGPGIPPDRREQVFEMGYTTNDDGTGFGLNIVRSIADAHGWDVSVGESDAGGARFEFSGIETIDSTPTAP